ncbi:hypothetical protein [Paludibaculum fermentans]|uniref:hypothetical protein n=1 Tax=Paludibaculum fermentans TaxID=1473598 RepID=UPI003EBC5A31
MSSQNQPARLLQSWKEIAAFFDVTVRTVQNWEEEHNLPIHRMPGTKGRIFAYADELDTWRKQRDGVKAEAEEVPPLALPELPVARAESRTRLIVVVAACLVLAALGAFWVMRPRPNPNMCRIEGQTLVVYDEQGVAAWNYKLPFVPYQGDVRRDPSFDSWQIADVDGDGRREVLFPLRNNLDSSLDDELYLFSADGQLLWKRHFAKPVLRDGFMLKGPFTVRRIALVPINGSKESRILVAATHRLHSPSLISLLDTNGNMLREYWHAGHITSLLVDDHGNDGRALIYLGGIANGYRAADLTVLDPDKFGGASVESDPAEQIVTREPTVEKARLLLSRSSLNLATNPYNLTEKLMLVGESLLVGTDENPTGPDKASNMYYFGPKLKLERVQAADMNWATFRKLHQQGLIPSDLTEKEVSSYRQIKVLTPWKD